MRENGSLKTLVQCLAFFEAKKNQLPKGGVVTGSLQATSGNTALLLLPTLNTQGVCRKDFFLSTYIETTESEKSSRKMNFFLFFFWQVSRKKKPATKGDGHRFIAHCAGAQHCYYCQHSTHKEFAGGFFLATYIETTESEKSSQ